MLSESQKDLIRKIAIEECRNERLLYITKKAALYEARDNNESESVVESLRKDFKESYDALIDMSFDISASCEVALRGINASLAMEEKMLLQKKEEMENAQQSVLDFKTDSD